MFHKLHKKIKAKFFHHQQKPPVQQNDGPHSFIIFTQQTETFIPTKYFEDHFMDILQKNIGLKMRKEKKRFEENFDIALDCGNFHITYADRVPHATHFESHGQHADNFYRHRYTFEINISLNKLKDLIVSPYSTYGNKSLFNGYQAMEARKQIKNAFVALYLDVRGSHVNEWYRYELPENSRTKNFYPR